MNDARKTLLNRKIPAYLGFFVLLFALVITVVLSGNTVLFMTKASVGSDPKNIQVSNITNTSFTVFYMTDAAAAGSVSYGAAPTTASIALDDRDEQASGSANHNVHFITVSNLTPGTQYYYVINSGDKKTANGDVPFEVTTASASSQLANEPTLSGTVAMSDGSIPPEGIVYLTVSNGHLATLIKPDGSYQLQLNQLQVPPESLTPDTVLQLQAVTPTQQSVAKILFSNAAQVPKIILSQNYDFTLGTSQASLSPSPIASTSGFPELATPAPVSSPEITTPIDAQSFKDQQPLFQGRALPNTDVEITIQSQQEISTKVQSNKSGLWQFRPPTNLAPGQHTITIKSVNAAGILQTISRSFTVYAQGSKFVEPSVSPVATPTVITTPTTGPTPTLAPTTKPTPSPTAAPIPTTAPTRVPSKAPIPPTGSSASVTGIVAGLTILGIGALLFILSVV